MHVCWGDGCGVRMCVGLGRKANPYHYVHYRLQSYHQMQLYCLYRYIGNAYDCRAPSPGDLDAHKQGLAGVYDGPVRAAVLDFGADVSGQQYQVFSQYFEVGWGGCFEVGWVF